MTRHETVRDVAHSARKQLDPTAFAAVATDFFHTDKFWDLTAGRTENRLVDVLTLCTDGIRNDPPARDEDTRKVINQILDDAVETVKKSCEARGEPFHYNKTLTDIRIAAIKYMDLLLGQDK